MGRTNPKLGPFLRFNLEMNSFMNLKYEEGSDIFSIELPRFDKEKCGGYEAILKAWYEFNGKSHKYVGYSNGKSVFQAALKKSVYLISLVNIGKLLRFRFASEEEVKEKKRLSKEKTQKDLCPSSPSDPPSVASSGYHSGCDSDAESMQVTEMLNEDPFWSDLLNNPEKYIGNCDDALDSLNDLVKDFDMDAVKEESPAAAQAQNTQLYPVPVPAENTQLDGLKPFGEMPQFMKKVTELKTTPVGLPGSVKKYWLCTQKMKIKTTLQLICELQVIEDDNSGIKEGSVVFPNDVFEPGTTYELKKCFELNDMCYYFFTPNSI